MMSYFDNVFAMFLQDNCVKICSVYSIYPILFKFDHVIYKILSTNMALFWKF